LRRPCAFAGGPRIFSLLAFLLAALYARTVHYDNTIGAETVSVFLTCLAVFIASGSAFRKWPPFLSAAGVGLSLGAAMACRSAAVGSAIVILIWLAASVDGRWVRRLGVLALASGVTAAVYLAPAGFNRIVGMQPAGNENLSVMSFIVGYSADFDRGVHLDRKSLARQFVAERRAAEGELGWADTDQYQWPLDAIARMRRPNESRPSWIACSNRVMRPVMNWSPFCCGLTISSEYDHEPGPIRWLSASTLILLLVGEVVGRRGRPEICWRPAP
jgi:hypothetical protein